MLIDLIVSGDPYKNIFLKEITFSVKINKILVPVNKKVDDFLNKIAQT